MYKNWIKDKYNEVYDREYNRFLGGKTSENAKTSAERKAQHNAILETFTEGYKKYYGQVSAADIWYAIYSAHVTRKTGKFDSENLTEDIINNVISGHQSWIKTSGHVFEHYIVETTREELAKYNIRLVLQKELTEMIHKGQIQNEAEDKILEMAKSENFDIYALITVNGHNFVFGCIQAKTSIRDRVGRDRDFSIPVMERHFWSPAVTIDGKFLSLPKFINMVNGGGDIEYQENGWHGMYAMSGIETNDRIYKDEKLELLIEDANQASQKFISARQRFDRYWKAADRG